MKLDNLDKKLVWHPYTQMKEWNSKENRVISAGRGFNLIDINGNEFLDGIASMWCNVWGHSENQVIMSMQDQLKKLPHSTLFGLANEPSITFAEKFLKKAKGMDKVFYTDNGSTAIESAMKMALQYYKNKGISGKNKFISLENGYHGDTIGAMSVGYVKKFFGSFDPLLKKSFRAPSPLLHTSKFKNNNDLISDCLDRTEKILKKNEKNCCAFIMESGAQIAGGVVIYPPGYQKEIANLCKKYDVLLILDEIATAFGRLGNLVEYISQRSIPDIACFGKALTGGYFPIAVTVTTDEIYDSFLGKYEQNRQFYHGHTFTGHPVGCAAAISNMELYEKRKLMQQVRTNSKFIADSLRTFKESPLVGDLRHKGLLAGIELEYNGEPLEKIKNQFISDYILRESLKMGVFLRSLGNIITIIPPIAMDKKHIAKILMVTAHLVQNMEKEIIGHQTLQDIRLSSL